MFAVLTVTLEEYIKVYFLTEYIKVYTMSAQWFSGYLACSSALSFSFVEY
jgi:hypothetical protein